MTAAVIGWLQNFRAGSKANHHDPHHNQRNPSPWLWHTVLYPPLWLLSPPHNLFTSLYPTHIFCGFPLHQFNLCCFLLINICCDTFLLFSSTDRTYHSQAPPHLLLLILFTTLIVPLWLFAGLQVPRQIVFPCLSNPLSIHWLWVSFWPADLLDCAVDQLVTGVRQSCQSVTPHGEQTVSRAKQWSIKLSWKKSSD